MLESPIRSNVKFSLSRSTFGGSTEKGGSKIMQTEKQWRYSVSLLCGVSLHVQDTSGGIVVQDHKNERRLIKE